MLLIINIGFFVKSMGRTVTASGGNMYQLQLSKPMQLKFCGTLTYTVIGARKPDITIVDQIKKEVLLWMSQF